METLECMRPGADPEVFVRGSPWRARGARAYNGDMEARPGWWGVRRLRPAEAESFFGS